jgi:hypothetical protein
MTTGSSRPIGPGSTGPSSGLGPTTGSMESSSTGSGSGVGYGTSATTQSASDAQLDTIVQAYRSCLQSRM